VISYIKENFKDSLEDDAVKHAINVITLRQEAGKGLPADKLRERIKNNPDDFEARYELSGILFS
jgi:thioredoxin-like negative regulator of GroEL